MDDLKKKLNGRIPPKLSSIKQHAVLKTNLEPLRSVWFHGINSWMKDDGTYFESVWFMGKLDGTTTKRKIFSVSWNTS